MKSITELNVAELLFEAGVARDEYKRAYKRMKDVEEELDRRYRYKIDMAIATGGRRGVREALDIEMENIEEEVIEDAKSEDKE